MNVETRGRHRLQWALPAVIGLLLLALVVPSPAQAAFPGANGRIAYKSGNDEIRIWTPLSASTSLTPLGSQEENPAWSPDGRKIAFVKRDSPCGQEIWTMNADGSGKAPLVTTVAGYPTVCPPLDNPAWSRDGSRIVFEVIGPGAGDIARADTSGTNVNVTPIIMTNTSDERDPVYAPNSNKIAFARKVGAGRYELRTINDDGSSPAALLADGTRDLRGPNWSPDGTQLVYQSGGNGMPADWDVFKVNANGTGNTAVRATALREQEPAWAPEGNMIVYAQQAVSGSDHDLYTINPDGTGISPPSEPRPATIESEPDWQPVRAAQVRPLAATPQYLPLVIAYANCTSPNTTHQAFGSPPATLGSCAPPTQSSGDITAGDPGVNGQPANFVGHIRTRAVPGDSAFDFALEDVRCARNVAGACPDGPLGDYLGPIAIRNNITITDRSNPSGTAGTTGPGTITMPLGLVPCSATPSTTTGSTCSFSSTWNAFFAGAVVAGRRAIWRLDSAVIADFAGGNPSSGAPFAVSGVFVP